MNNKLIVFEEKLSNIEKNIIQSLHKLSNEVINNCFDFSFKNNIIALKFMDISNAFCPFEIIFSRENDLTYFSFYIGYGAEVACHEQIGDKNNDHLLIHDIDSFLRSNVRAEYIFDSGEKIIKATYYPDLLLQEVPNASYVFRSGYILFFKKYISKAINYRPLIENRANHEK